MASSVKYSQEGEQDIIINHFGTRSGHFLDIGAYDGIWCSNTHQLALNGWDGLCIEACPVNFSRLMANYKGNHHIALLNAFIGFNAGITLFHSLDAVSSNDIEHIKQFGNTNNAQSIYVPVVELATIHNSFANKYDFISIDVEGGSIDLFKEVLPLYKPELICVEHEHNQSDCTAFASSNNYSLVYSGGINMIFTANTKTA